MNVRPLWDLDYPGLSNEVVHFTGRISNEVNINVAPEIGGMSPRDRLVAVLCDGLLIPHHPYGSLGEPSVCFTEATPPGLEHLVHRQRYAPWALGFTKQFIFEAGGGPAHYVRGSDWQQLRDSNVSARLKAFATRFWPGATAAEGEPPLPDHLARPSQWYYEREWRLPLPEGTAFTFSLADVVVIVVPDTASAAWLTEAVPGLDQHLAHMDVVTIASPVASLPETPEDGYDLWDPDDPQNPYAEIVKEILGLD